VRAHSITLQRSPQGSQQSAVRDFYLSGALGKNSQEGHAPGCIVVDSGADLLGDRVARPTAILTTCQQNIAYNTLPGSQFRSLWRYSGGSRTRSARFIIKQCRCSQTRIDATSMRTLVIALECGKQRSIANSRARKKLPVVLPSWDFFAAHIFHTFLYCTYCITSGYAVLL